MTLEHIDQWGSQTVSTLLGLFAKNPQQAAARIPAPIRIEHPSRPKPKGTRRPTSDRDEIKRFLGRLGGNA